MLLCSGRQQLLKCVFHISLWGIPRIWKVSGLVKVPWCLSWGKTMGENHSCFSEGFCREVLLSQWLPPFSRSEGANMRIVSTRKADPTPKVSPGKALTWLLYLVLAWSCPQLFLWTAVPVLQLWAAPSSSSHSSRAGRDRDRGDAHGHCDPFVQRGSVQQESAEQPW